MGQQVLVVHVEGGGALHGTHEICKRDGRCLSNDEVDMVGGEACDEQDAAALLGLGAEERAERGVERLRQKRSASRRGPHDVDERKDR